MLHGEVRPVVVVVVVVASERVDAVVGRAQCCFRRNDNVVAVTPGIQVDGYQVQYIVSRCMPDIFIFHDFEYIRSKCIWWYAWLEVRSMRVSLFVRADECTTVVRVVCAGTWCQELDDCFGFLSAR